MLEKVISGGQTGADQGGWRAARACAIPTGGWMPLGFLTEDGPRPEFAGLYGAQEMPGDDYVARTWQNAMFADATLWFGSLDSSGSRTTHKAAVHHARPIYDVVERTLPDDVAAWIRVGGFKVLNVAGNRESTNPGIGAEAERFLIEVFRRLAGR